MTQRWLARIRLVLVAALSGVMLTASASGPGLRVTPEGDPFAWDNSQPIFFNLDQGTLGRLSHDDAARLVQTAFQQWQQIDTAQLEFQEAQSLDRDVTGANLIEFLNNLPGDVNPVLFDQDGTITDAFLGEGASQSTFAYGRPWNTASDGRIVQGIIILNGRAFDGLFGPDDPTEDEMVRNVVRAIGQMLNIGSSDLNDELIYDGDIANNRSVPIMNLFYTVEGGSNLTLDDRMAASMLYPSEKLDTQTGVIRGRVLLPDGKTGLQGVAVVARKVGDPLNSAVSAITGTTFENVTLRGSRDPARRGAFELRVPPGSYTLEFRSLRAPIGPLQSIVPLPGGRRFYAPTPAADPGQAAPVTVTAGQTTEVSFTTSGASTPAQALMEIEPNDAPYQAPLLPPSATVTGRASAVDTGQMVLDVGGGARDDIEDLYRLEIRERSIVTLLLEPKAPADLDLYLFAGILGGASSANVSSATATTQAEALQLTLGPGSYTVGISAQDNVQSPVATDYTLSVTVTPTADPAPAPTPVLQQLVIGDVGAASAEMRSITDRDATADAVLSLPRRQFGDSNAGKAHRIPLTGLTPGADLSLFPVHQAPGGARSFMPPLFFRTARPGAAEGPAKVVAAVIGTAAETIEVEEAARDTVLLVIGVHNTGGSATEVRLTELTTAAGWRLAQPVTEPIAVGGVGSGGTALVVVRLIREGSGRAPLATVGGKGSFSSAGATQTFTIGP